MKNDNIKNQYRVNEQIRVREVRIVGDGGSTVVPTRQALDMARDQGVDLVEISPNANPPVCRLIDYSKFLYQQKKRQKEMKAKQVKVEVKEIRFGPQTDEHDYQFKLKHAKEFLEEGNKVRAYVFFRGRSILFKEQGEVTQERHSATRQIDTEQSAKGDVKHDAKHDSDDRQTPPFLFSQQHTIAEHDQCTRHHEAKGFQDEGGHNQDDHAKEHLGFEEYKAVFPERRKGEFRIAFVLFNDLINVNGNTDQEQNNDCLGPHTGMQHVRVLHIALGHFGLQHVREVREPQEHEQEDIAEQFKQRKSAPFFCLFEYEVQETGEEGTLPRPDRNFIKDYFRSS